MKIKLKEPKIPYDGWMIESDVRQKAVDLSDVVLHLDEGQKNGNYITGNELRKKLECKNPLSASVLDYLIEHPEKTPEAWKEKTADGSTQFIFFWGTIYRRSHGDLYVRCLYWCGGRWRWSYRWLDDSWDGHDPAAVLASPQSSDTSPSLDSKNLELLSDFEARLEAVEGKVEAILGMFKTI